MTITKMKNTAVELEIEPVSNNRYCKYDVENSVSSDKLFAEDVVTEQQAALIEYRACRGPLTEHQRKARLAKLSRYFQKYEEKSRCPGPNSSRASNPPGPEFFVESIKVFSVPENVMAQRQNVDEDHSDRFTQ